MPGLGWRTGSSTSTTGRCVVVSERIHEHLRQHLGPPPQRVVDVGGGAGNQSAPLARAGHDVTIVDPSAAMLERAIRRLSAEDEEVATRVRLVKASGETAPEVLGGAVFDAVLCHGVLMYLDDPEPLVGSLCELTAPRRRVGR